MKEKIFKWANENRVMIAALSVIGSFAGLIFAGLDLQTSMEERKKKRELEEYQEDERKGEEG